MTKKNSLRFTETKFDKIFNIFKIESKTHDYVILFIWIPRRFLVRLNLRNLHWELKQFNSLGSRLSLIQTSDIMT